jgi:hypothetical protein|nr:hypothetical protein [Neorhizobium tomejilense]
MDDRYTTRRSGETAFGNFMTRHLKLIMCLMIATPFVLAALNDAPGEPGKTVWISDRTTLSAYEDRARFVLDALETGTVETYSEIIAEAPSGELARFDGWRVDLTKGFPPGGDMRRRIEWLNEARQKISRLAAKREGVQIGGANVASRSTP